MKEALGSSPDQHRELVELAPGPKGGLTVPVEALGFVLELEERGFTMSARGDKLQVRPASELTPGDVDRIKRWKPHMLALVAYEAPARKD